MSTQILNLTPHEINIGAAYKPVPQSPAKP